MGKYFNTTGACDPQRHYMVDITERLREIKKLVDAGEYFTINRARQYGKTTTLKALAEYLKDEYVVLPMDFQMIGNEEFSSATIFCKAFVSYLVSIIRNRKSPIRGLDEVSVERMESDAKKSDFFSLRSLFMHLSELCDMSERPVVLLVDEVDSATNNQVFLDFLAQLREYYLKRDTMPTFQSVILAGVYDVKNIKRKIRADEEHKVNSPWNIAADFDVAMGLPREGIGGMLADYEADHGTGMNIEEMAELLFDYTSGYPFLVSRLCKLMDEKVAESECFPLKSAAWTKEGFQEALKLLLSEKNTLFESLMGKLLEYPELQKKIYRMLFGGTELFYNVLDDAVDMAIMLGFVKKVNGKVVISNRIYEILLYNYFLDKEKDAQSDALFSAGVQNRSQFIHDGHLDVELVLSKFVDHFDQIYGDNVEPFDEDEGCRRFLLYLRPIINGTGNYYIEAETRNSRRMDVVVDYRGEQHIIELKIWRGEAYHKRGEKQLSDYLDYFHLKKGYMLSYNFNKKKEVGLKEIRIGDRVLVEAVV